jgi:hypothetical protein
MNAVSVFGLEAIDFSLEEIEEPTLKPAPPFLYF